MTHATVAPAGETFALSDAVELVETVRNGFVESRTPGAAVVTGQDIWMINANESVALEYSRHNYVAEDLYSADQWRSSDHNPILVGLQLDAPVTEPTPEPEPSPGETCDGVTDPRGVPGKPANSVREWLR